MNPTLRNALAVVLGILIGGSLNGFLISISSSVIPLPNGIDPNDMEALMAKAKDFPAKNFIMPFLAHALGTMLAAIIAVKVAVSDHMKMAWIVGFIYFVFGIIMAFQIGAPMWYNVVDVLFAYFPMAFIGAKLAGASVDYSNR